jgi:hypothetical protein
MNPEPDSSLTPEPDPAVTPEPDPDELVVLCSLVEDGPSGVYGSTKEECSSCHKKVWLSPGTRTTVERAGPTYKLLCLPCGVKRLEEHPSPDDKLMMPSPEQLRELLKEWSELN